MVERNISSRLCGRSRAVSSSAERLAAARMYGIYTAFVEAGFSEQQATLLTKEVLRRVIDGDDPIDQETS